MIRLLIADDEALERETLADIVARRFEHEVTIETAENGRKAADTAVLWGADLILMDIEMPGMNGLDAARALQSWLRWNRSRKLTRRAMPPKQGRTTAMHWSWPMCASIWRITICSTSRWTV